jgi:uncharacterized membrane protein YhfC
LWEEGFRYAAYRWWAKDARSWRKAVLMGAGHGGIEAILLGLLAFFTFLQLVSLKNADLTTLIPADQMDLAQQQVANYWSSPWYATLLGAGERIFAMTAQIALSVIVLQVFTRGHIRWLWLAICWHALINAIGLYILGTWGAYMAEATLAFLTLVNLGIIFALRQPEPEIVEIEPSPLPELVSVSTLADVDATAETLERTRYN